MVAAALAVGIFSIFVHRLLLRKVQHNELAQVLLTFGLLLMISDATIWIWVGSPHAAATGISRRLASRRRAGFSRLSFRSHRRRIVIGDRHLVAAGAHARWCDRKSRCRRSRNGSRHRHQHRAHLHPGIRKWGHNGGDCRRAWGRPAWGISGSGFDRAVRLRL